MTKRRLASPLDKKLFRDLWRAKGQAFAIALVVSVGIALLVMMAGNVESLSESRRAYFERYRFADMFAPVVRAPEHILQDIESIPDVSVAEGRIIGSALVNLVDADIPIRAQTVSLPQFGRPILNDVYLTAGRLIDPARDNEILLLDGFAAAHALVPGDSLDLTLHGARRMFRIVGLAQSPEFIYTVAPGEMMPDDSRFAVIWMNEDTLAASLDMAGAYNDFLIGAGQSVNAQRLLDELDRILAPYGALGAYSRDDQISNRYLTEEIRGQIATLKVLPPIFLLVAAFLLNIVVTRMIHAEREQIGLLKSFGYSSRNISVHYFKFILIIALVGAVGGCLLGVSLGNLMAQLYTEFYKIPDLVFRVNFGIIILSFAIAILSAIFGAWNALRSIFNLTPAVAMRPPAPPDYSRLGKISGLFNKVLDQPTRMVIRRIQRQPGRAAAACLGIAVAMGLSASLHVLMTSFDEMLEINYGLIDRSDLTVTFVEPLSDKSVYALKAIKGIEQVEPFRGISAVLKNGVESHNTSIIGLTDQPSLFRAVDGTFAPVTIRDDGIILGIELAKKLKIAPGDVLTVEIREGQRPVLTIPVASTVSTLVGSPAYMELDALNRAIGEQNRISGAYLLIDKLYEKDIQAALKDMPAIAGISISESAKRSLEEFMDQGAGAMRYVMAVFAWVITIAIVYNSARVAFAERARDLASLRVLGFSHGEASFVLLGELAIIILLALPIGVLIGLWLSESTAAAFSTDLFQIPSILNTQSFGEAALAVIGAAIFSGWLVQRDVRRIDLVSALKVRE